MIARVTSHVRPAQAVKGSRRTKPSHGIRHSSKAKGINQKGPAGRVTFEQIYEDFFARERRKNAFHLSGPMWIGAAAGILLYSIAHGIHFVFGVDLFPSNFPTVYFFGPLFLAYLFAIGWVYTIDIQNVRANRRIPISRSLGDQLRFYGHLKHYPIKEVHSFQEALDKNTFRLPFGFVTIRGSHVYSFTPEGFARASQFLARWRDTFDRVETGFQAAAIEIVEGNLKTHTGLDALKRTFPSASIIVRGVVRKTCRITSLDGFWDYKNRCLVIHLSSLSIVTSPDELNHILDLLAKISKAIEQRHSYNFEIRRARFRSKNRRELQMEYLPEIDLEPIKIALTKPSRDMIQDLMDIADSAQIPLDQAPSYLDTK